MSRSAQPPGAAPDGDTSGLAAVLRLTLSAIALGAACGAAAAVTYLGMILLQQAIWTAAGDLRWMILPITVLGGALIGWTRLNATGYEIERQIADARRPERIHLRETFWVGLGAIFAVGFGGAIGPEAGIIAVTAQLSAVVALRLGRSAGERRMLAEAGVSGALSGVYGSPAGGPVHSEPEGRAPKPVLFAAGLSGFAAFVILAETLRPGALHLMHLPRFTAEVGRWDTLIALLPAAAGALAGALFLGLKLKAGHLLSRHVSGPFWQPVVGGAALGLICMAAPLLLFSGHEQLRELVHIGQMQGPLPLILLAMGKVLACTVCVAAGWRGGVVFPMCFAGGALGGATLFLLPGVDPVLGVAAGMSAAAAVGMTRPLVAGLIMLFILGGALAVPVFIGTLAGWGLLTLLPKAWRDAGDPHGI
jgi:H+/Cl- antiporter ClcA